MLSCGNEILTSGNKIISGYHKILNPCFHSYPALIKSFPPLTNSFPSLTNKFYHFPTCSLNLLGRSNSFPPHTISFPPLTNSFPLLIRGHGGRAVILSPPTSETGVQFPARPQVGKLVVACHWLAVYSTEP